jgi:hypothetical protein
LTNNRLSFSVENIQVVDDPNSAQFSKLKIDAFASGENLHNLYVSDDSLKKASKTILEKPIVWIYNKVTQDATTHGENESPVGFIPADSPIEFTVLPDKRTMMTVWGKIWDRYS